MADDILYQLLAKVPPNTERAIVLHHDTRVAGRAVPCVNWIGMTPEQVVLMLLEMADEVMAQRVPPKAWAPPK